MQKIFYESFDFGLTSKIVQNIFQYPLRLGILRMVMQKDNLLRLAPSQRVCDPVSETIWIRSEKEKIYSKNSLRYEIVSKKFIKNILTLY